MRQNPALLVCALGIAAAAALVGAGLWAWQRWGLAVWLDAAMAFCL
ncbi:hypothetical protein [Oleisolibacter albus]|nr:hypothetical protein [Oleisolibacter albus]